MKTPLQVICTIDALSLWSGPKLQNPCYCFVTRCSDISDTVRFYAEFVKNCHINIISMCLWLKPGAKTEPFLLNSLLSSFPEGNSDEYKTFRRNVYNLLYEWHFFIVKLKKENTNTHSKTVSLFSVFCVHRFSAFSLWKSTRLLLLCK